MIDDAAPLNYKVAYAHGEMNPKKRHTMEDVHRVLPTLEDLPLYSYFGVYDGHGGRQIADFLEGALETNIINELKLTDDDATILERLSRAFLITDMQSRKSGIVASGATAVSVLLKRSEDGLDKTLYVGNVGDSRAILVTSKPENESDKPTSSGFYARRLTFDHRAEDEGEQERIKAAGGFVTRGRVLGILAVTRSFGDHGMKDFVTASPYLTETRLSDCGECPMLILACDGVWDVMTDQETADLLINRYKEKGGPDEDVAKYIVKTAIKKGSADNITAIVVYL